METVLREIVRPAGSARGAISVSEHHAQRLEAAIPRFRDEGAVYGGPAIVDAGETKEDVGGLGVIYREGSSHVQSPETPPQRDAVAGAAVRRDAVAGAAARRAPVAAPPTPQAEAHRAPPADNEPANKTHGGLGAGRGGGTVGAAGGPVQIEGTLAIDGLRDWVGKVTGVIKNV